EAPEEPLLQPLLATNIDTVFSGFPPSFTDMLTQFSCKTEKDAEEPYPVTATDHAPQEVSMLDTSHNVAISTTSANEIDVNRETSDIMTRIKRHIYLMAPSMICCSSSRELLMNWVATCHCR
ncbi:Os06g0473000, partial [Oryza sativa Japonica Group]